jgi:hypothetical protein
MRFRLALFFSSFSSPTKNASVLKLFLSAHSRSRNTVQPWNLKARVTRLSRRWLTATFSFQNATLLFGGRLQRLHPCQKQPSTNTATLERENTKSGFPGNRGSFIFHPDTPRRTRWARRRFSVVLPCRGFTSDMMRERASVDTRSINVFDDGRSPYCKGRL